MLLVKVSVNPTTPNSFCNLTRLRNSAMKMHKPVFTFKYRIFTAAQLDFARGGQRILKLDGCISRNNASWHNLASLLFGGNHICSESEGNKRPRFWKGKHNLLRCVCLRTSACTQQTVTCSCELVLMKKSMMRL